MKRATIISILFLLFAIIYPAYVFAQPFPFEIESFLSTIPDDKRVVMEERLQQMFPDGFPTTENVQLQIIKDTVEITTIPPSPNPYDEVTIKVKS